METFAPINHSFRCSLSPTAQRSILSLHNSMMTFKFRRDLSDTVGSVIGITYLGKMKRMRRPTTRVYMLYVCWLLCRSLSCSSDPEWASACDLGHITLPERSRSFKQKSLKFMAANIGECTGYRDHGPFAVMRKGTVHYQEEKLEITRWKWMMLVLWS